MDVLAELSRVEQQEQDLNERRKAPSAPSNDMNDTYRADDSSNTQQPEEPFEHQISDSGSRSKRKLWQRNEYIFAIVLLLLVLIGGVLGLVFSLKKPQDVADISSSAASIGTSGILNHSNSPTPMPTSVVDAKGQTQIYRPPTDTTLITDRPSISPSSQPSGSLMLQVPLPQVSLSE